jgi:undecaprenyl pyrophosphate phosphatase UppP
MPLSLLILVAAIQGLTEFLPSIIIGSFGADPIVTDFSLSGPVIDVAAHVGTLVAVAFYLRAEIIVNCRWQCFALGAMIRIMHGLASCLFWQPFQ